VRGIRADHPAGRAVTADVSYSLIPSGPRIGTSATGFAADTPRAAGLQESESGKEDAIERPSHRVECSRWLVPALPGKDGSAHAD